MEDEIEVDVHEPVVLQSTDVVYEQKPYWCNATRYPLKMSILHPRHYFSYDEAKGPYPCIVWIAGGGWTEVDQNVWLPEMAYFVKHGYIVASVSYSLPSTWVWPEMLIDVKQAIRYLKAHAGEWEIDKDKIAVAGESAGGHLAAMAAVTGDNDAFEKGNYLNQSSSVQAAVILYGAVDMENFEGRRDKSSYKIDDQSLLRGHLEPQTILCGEHYLFEHPEIAKTMDPRNYISFSTPPFMLLHGTKDTQVPIYHSDIFYKALSDNGICVDYLRISGADHASAAFYQPEVKNRIIYFLNDKMNIKG